MLKGLVYSLIFFSQVTLTPQENASSAGTVEVPMICALAIEVVLEDLRERIQVKDIRAYMLNNHQSIVCGKNDSGIYLRVTPPLPTYRGMGFVYLLSEETLKIEFFREQR